MDDNQEITDEIMNAVRGRLELGRARYGHGVVVDHDTTKFGTETDDWELMALEEALDGLVYTTAAILRIRRAKMKK